MIVSAINDHRFIFSCPTRIHQRVLLARMLGTDSVRDPKLLFVDDVVAPGRTSRWYQNSYTGCQHAA